MNELNELEQKREQICFSMVEADNDELRELELELEEVEQRIEQLKGELNE